MSEYTRTLQEQETAEAIVEDFREQLGPFVVAAEKTRMAMLFTDAKIADNPIIFANDAFLDLTGFTRDEVLGVCFKSLMARGIASEAVAQIENAFAGCADREPEICYQRKRGSNFWESVFISPVCDRSGTVEQHFISLIDLTGQREKQAHCEMLIDELNHRVKNTLVTVQSIVRQSLRATTDPAVIRTSIEARIFALSRSHDLLSRHNWEGADLRGLIEAELKPVTDKNGHAERVKVEGPDFCLSPKATLALGIAFHELATNAVKYGALSNDAGMIRIAWTVDRKAVGDRLILSWRETDGPRVMPPAHKGFGAQVIERGLAHELDGQVSLEYFPAGVVCTIDVPAPRRTTDD